MVRATSEKVGRGTCLHCGESVTYRRSAGGMLKSACDACDMSAYAPRNSEAERAMLATIKNPAPVPQDTPTHSPKEPAPAPTPRPRNSAFDVGAL